MKKLFVLAAFLFAFNFANAQQMALGVGGNVFLPMGSFGDVVSMGFGGNAKFEYKLQQGLHLTGAVGYLTFSPKDDIIGWTYSVIPVLAGAKYYFSKGMPFYGMAEVGINFASVTVKIPSYSFMGQTFGGGESTASGSEFGFNFGAGYELPVGKSALDIYAKYQSFESSVAGINVGVAYKFGL